MLRSFHINKFRSCSEVRLLNLSEVTALVGRNGAGKTNILQALEWLAKLVTGQSPRNPFSAIQREDGTVSVEFSIRGQEYWYSVERAVSVTRLDDGSLEENITFREELNSIRGTEHHPILARDGELTRLTEANQDFNVSLDSSSIFALLALLPKEDALRTELLRIWFFFSRIAYYPLLQQKHDEVSIVLSSEYDEWKKGVWHSHIAGAKNTIMKIFRLKLENESSFSELQSILGPNQLDLIDEIVVLSIPFSKSSGTADQRAFFIQFRPCGHTDTFSFEKLSFGTQRVLSMIVSMLADETSVALIEQPEDGIHPALLDKLIDIIRTYTMEKQLFISSHSPIVLDALDPLEIKLVELANGRTYARSLDDTEINAARNYLAKEGPLSAFVESL
jgi:predicted ATPase